MNLILIIIFIQHFFNQPTKVIFLNEIPIKQGNNFLILGIFLIFGVRKLRRYVPSHPIAHKF